MELPDAWTIIVDSENNFLRIFAQYRADGFFAGMHTRLSSGFHLRDVTERENEYLIIQQSGTTYSLRKEDEGVGDSYMRSELNNILSRFSQLSTTNLSLELAEKDIDIAALKRELIAFFGSTDDMEEWLDSFVPILESKPCELMSSSEGRRNIRECIESMKNGDLA